MEAKEKQEAADPILPASTSLLGLQGTKIDLP